MAILPHSTLLPFRGGSCLAIVSRDSIISVSIAQFCAYLYVSHGMVIFQPGTVRERSSALHELLGLDSRGRTQIACGRNSRALLSPMRPILLLENLSLLDQSAGFKREAT